MYIKVIKRYFNRRIRLMIVIDKKTNQINNSIDTNMNIKSENETNNSIDMNIKSENEINNSIDTNMNIKSENEINNSIDTNMNIKSENEINNSIDTNMNIKSENEINNSIDMNIKSENEINNSIDTNMNIKLENNEEIDIQKNYEVISKLFGEEFVCYKNETEEDIIKYHINNEKKYMVDCEYMKKQSDINESMRKILIDWLVDVRYKFEFKSKTLYLCVNIIDRFLSKKIVARNKLQLVGLVAMMIAAKYQEKHIPEISEFIHISAYAYTKDELISLCF